MKIHLLKWGCRLLLGVSGPAVAQAVTPVLHLAEQADLVLLGEAVAMELSAGGGVELDIRPRFTLKGEAPASVFTAALPPSGLMAQHAERTASIEDGEEGWYGLWFLKQAAGGGYVILPAVSSDYIERESLVTVPRSWTPPPGANLERRILLVLQESYTAQRRPKPPMAEALLTMSLQAADRDAALQVVESLMESSQAEERITGIDAGIRLGSAAALRRLASNLDSLQLEKDFSRIVFTLHNVYKPNGPEEIAVLQDLIERRSGAPGLDAAIGHALWRVLNRELLPLAALLLDSPDPEAQRAAGWLFHTFTALAGPAGRIKRPSSSGPHPFWNEDTRWFAGKSKRVAADEQAAFWTQWWAEHREQLGFGR